jgi:hypothetical protein
VEREPDPGTSVVGDNEHGVAQPGDADGGAPGAGPGEAGVDEGAGRAPGSGGVETPSSDRWY